MAEEGEIEFCLCTRLASFKNRRIWFGRIFNTSDLMFGKTI